MEGEGGKEGKSGVERTRNFTLALINCSYMRAMGNGTGRATRRGVGEDGFVVRIGKEDEAAWLATMQGHEGISYILISEKIRLVFFGKPTIEPVSPARVGKSFSEPWSHLRVFLTLFLSSIPTLLVFLECRRRERQM